MKYLPLLASFVVTSGCSWLFTEAEQQDAGFELPDARKGLVDAQPQGRDASESRCEGLDFASLAADGWIYRHQVGMGNCVAGLETTPCDRAAIQCSCSSGPEDRCDAYLAKIPDAKKEGITFSGFLKVIELQPSNKQFTFARLLASGEASLEFIVDAEGVYVWDKKNDSQIHVAMPLSQDWQYFEFAVVYGESSVRIVSVVGNETAEIEFLQGVATIEALEIGIPSVEPDVNSVTALLGNISYE